MPSITNDFISISVATLGAELQSIYHQQHKLEYMWSGDAAYWGKYSPVLFPIVGELKNGTYSYNGQNYHLSRHGFAREMNFEVTEQHSNSITFTLQSNEESLKTYPFQFLFSVRYTLEKNTLQVSFRTQNSGVEKMFFSVGAHPAFKVPLVEGTAYEDYQLVFSENETTGRWPIAKGGFIETQPVSMLKDEATINLKKELFASDAIVFKNLKSNAVSIVSPATEHGIKVSFKDFPFLGIWAAKGADFVCIEPWCGIADSVDATGTLDDKEGIISLEAGYEFTVSYEIEVF